MLEVIEDASGLMLYIVLEYGTAGTLHDAEDLELGQVRMYAQELLLALQYLHRSVSFRMIDRCALVLRCCISFQRGSM
jgi:serine/threonine protein kinase